MINHLIKYISFTTSTIIIKSEKDFGEVKNGMIVLKKRTKYLIDNALTIKSQLFVSDFVKIIGKNEKETIINFDLKSGLIPFIFKDELSLRKFKIMNCSINNIAGDYRLLFALEKDVKFLNNFKFFMKGQDNTDD